MIISMKKKKVMEGRGVTPHSLVVFQSKSLPAAVGRFHRREDE
jgi:hypothetical protein